MEAANLPIFLKFGNAENHNVISDAISHGDFNHILYQYEKRPSNIVEFCNSCWKTAKKRIFSYKVAFKKFYGRAKGGSYCTVALPLNMPLMIQVYDDDVSTHDDIQRRSSVHDNDIGLP